MLHFPLKIILLNHWVDFHKIFMNTPLTQAKEMIKTEGDLYPVLKFTQSCISPSLHGLIMLTRIRTL